MAKRLRVRALGVGWLLLAACPEPPQNPQAEGGSTSADATSSTSSTGAVDTSPEGSSAGPTSATLSGSGEVPPPPECQGDQDCDDGIFCNGAEPCLEGTCAPAVPPECDDGVGCTVDACDPARDACVHTPSNDTCGCAQTCDPVLDCGNHCVPVTCQGQLFDCGNCLDDDGDCVVDYLDPDCYGPCDYDETKWTNFPWWNQSPSCAGLDCYFDLNTGPGDDDCRWSQYCDPLEPDPSCPYDPNYDIPGTALNCDGLQMMQSAECLDVCGPLVPNGCDCFGCCEVQLPGATVTVFLGTPNEVTGHSECGLAVADDPAFCAPCTQVQACLNPCEPCELCLGQVELPPGCDEQVCPPGIQACGQLGQAPCPAGEACVTGCCGSLPW